MGDIDLARKYDENCLEAAAASAALASLANFDCRGHRLRLRGGRRSTEGVAGMNSTIELLKSRFHPNHREVRWLEARLAEFRPPAAAGTACTTIRCVSHSCWC